MNETQIRGWLEKAGATRIRTTGDKNLISTCPFHRDRKPSFSMRSDNGLFVCYSQNCGVSGNLINFLVSALGWKYRKARDAVDRLGIVSTTPIKDKVVLPSYLERKLSTNESYGAYTVTDGQLGLYDFCPKYLLNRGFDRKILRQWEVGYDFGSSCVTLPVRDFRGQLVGITKRKADDGLYGPKYLHLGFKRGKYLYGINKELTDTVVLLEGQLDVIAWDHFDSKITPLATMSSRITKHQMSLLSKNVKTVLMAFDDDEAGLAAMRKAGDLLLGRIKRNQLFVLRDWPTGVRDVADFLGKSYLDFKSFILNRELYSDVKVEGIFNG